MRSPMRQYTVDAFAEAPFKGNPACVVVPFDAWPEDGFMQALAMENNQAETAYLRRTGDPARFDLRWFTPAIEVPLCGHATLASAQVLFNELGLEVEELIFDTLSGPLKVRRHGDRLEMDFPAYPPHRIDDDFEIAALLGAEPVQMWGGPALIAQLASEEAVRRVVPDVRALKAYPGTAYTDRHLIVTALADDSSPYDIVSRLFAPDMGIDEDPATGSMHCMLAPLYRELMGQAVIDCYQAHPKRGARLQCEQVGDRVKLRGQAITVAETTLRL